MLESFSYGTIILAQVQLKLSLAMDILASATIDRFDYEKTLRPLILTLVILSHLLSCSGNAQNIFYFLAESIIIHIIVSAGFQLLWPNDNIYAILKRRSVDPETKLILTCSMTSLVPIVRILVSITVQYAPLVLSVSKSTTWSFLHLGIRSFLLLLLPLQLVFGNLCIVALSQLTCLAGGLYRLVFYMAGYPFRTLMTATRLGPGLLSTFLQVCKYILGPVGKSFVLLMDNLHQAGIRFISGLSWVEINLAKFFLSATGRMYPQFNQFVRYISPTISYTEERMRSPVLITNAKEMFACTFELARDAVEDAACWAQPLFLSILRHHTVPFSFPGLPYLSVKGTSLSFGSAAVSGVLTPKVSSFAKVFLATFVGIIVVIGGYSTVLRICRTGDGSRQHGILSRPGLIALPKGLQPDKGPDFNDANDHYDPNGIATASSTNDLRTQTLTIIDEPGFHSHMDVKKSTEPENTQELRSSLADSVVSEVPSFGEQRRFRMLTSLTSQALMETGADSSGVAKSLRVDVRVSDEHDPEEEVFVAAKCAAAVAPRLTTREARHLKHTEETDPYVMQIKEYEEKIQLIEEGATSIFVDHNNGSGKKITTELGLTPSHLFYLARGLEGARLDLARSEADAQEAAYTRVRNKSQNLYKLRAGKGAYSALDKLYEGDLDLVNFLDLEPDSEYPDSPHALLLPLAPFREELEAELQTIDLARKPVSETTSGSDSVDISAESEPADRLGEAPFSLNFSDKRDRGLPLMRPADQEGVRLASMAIHRELMRKGANDVMVG